MKARAADMARLVRILCAIALLCVGFAHKPVVVEAALAPSEIAAYTLPDGTLPVLCLPGDDGDGKTKSHDPGTGCEVCRLASSMVVPQPCDTIVLALCTAIEALLPIRHEAFHRQLFPPNTYPRGPPAGVLA